ncbi:MAG: AraC family transcriptional regulator [Rhodospirillaceae bacterium]|nr:AraC family transcriptional regulator [Rhodospirillaceae bacterium]
MTTEGKILRNTLIDFSDRSPSDLVKYYDHVCLGEFTICRCAFEPNPGMILESPQLVVGVVQAGTPFQLTWREGHTDRVTTIDPGQVNISGPHSRLYVQWPNASPSINVIAIEQHLVSRILASVGINPSAHMSPIFGVQDKVLRQLAQAGQDEIAECGEHGRLFTEGLAIAIVTHVYRSYAGVAFPKVKKGGLTPRDTRRVLTYIEEHLKTDIGLEDLAKSVGLSAHYFTEAFKKTIGMPPYRYLLYRRVQRAKELLSRDNLTPKMVAEEVGFSSQSQFTVNFRKVVGTTPARFRREAE